MIVLFGEQGCHQLKQIQVALRKRCVPTVILNTQQQPPDFSLSWWPQSTHGLINIHSSITEYAEIQAVYWYFPNYIDSLKNDDLSHLYLINTLYLYPEFQWVNPLQGLHLKLCNAYNMTVANKMGAALPPSYVGNNQDDICAFYERFGHRVKVYSFFNQHTNSETIGKKSTVHPYPLILRAYEERLKIRSFVVGHRVIHFSYEKFSTKTYKNVNCIELNSEHDNLCRRICRAFGMYICSIDWVRDSSGELLYIDCDPSPNFTVFSAASGVPLESILAEFLSQFC